MTSATRLGSFLPDGLAHLHIRNTSKMIAVYFEFESAEKAERAFEGVVKACDYTLSPSADKTSPFIFDVVKDNLLPEGTCPYRTFGLAAKKEGCVGTPILSALDLIAKAGWAMSQLNN